MSEPMSINVQPLGPGNAVILLDGRDVSAMVAGYSLTQDATSLAQLTITFGLLGVPTEFAGEARVRVRPEQAEVLIGLGWTPPDE